MGVAIWTLCMFGIQCICMHSLAVICICDVFNVICSIVCVGLAKRIISKMFFILYHQGSVVLAVSTTSFCCHCTGLSLILFMFFIMLFLRGFPRLIEIVDQIGTSILICCLLLKISTLIINFITY